MILSNKAIRNIHCLGIGGIGVSGIAEILLKKGYQVTGSDPGVSSNVARLQQLGAKVFADHSADNVGDAHAIVYSSAIQPNNPEFIAAQQRGLPMIKRGEMLGELMAQGKGIAISGTHGKTTTTSLAAHTLLTANVDATYVIGGVINNEASPVHVGSSEYFLAEADESDASFLYLKPYIAVVTNIDSDHLSTYQGDFNILKQTFINFLNQIPADGLAILCVDDPVVREILPQVRCRVIRYGLDESADLRACDFHQQELVSHFNVRDKKTGQTHAVQLNLAGVHNAVNALAVIAIAMELGVAPAAWQKGLASFPGVGRRFFAHGMIQAQNGTALLFDDYGHHPRELQATLAAARSAWPHRRLVWVFQPHRYSRTQELMQEFAEVLAIPDVLILLDIYSAGEAPIAGVSGTALAKLAQQAGAREVQFVAQIDQIVSILRQTVRDSDIVFLQGAGNIGVMAKQIAQELGYAKDTAL